MSRSCAPSLLDGDRQAGRDAPAAVSRCLVSSPFPPRRTNAHFAQPLQSRWTRACEPDPKKVLRNFLAVTRNVVQCKWSVRPGPVHTQMSKPWPRSRGCHLRITKSMSLSEMTAVRILASDAYASCSTEITADVGPGVVERHSEKEVVSTTRRGWSAPRSPTSNRLLRL